MCRAAPLIRTQYILQFSSEFPPLKIQVHFLCAAFCVEKLLPAGALYVWQIKLLFQRVNMSRLSAHFVAFVLTAFRWLSNDTQAKVMALRQKKPKCVSAPTAENTQDSSGRVPFILE